MKSAIGKALKGKKRYAIPIAVIFASLMILIVLAPAEKQIAAYNPSTVTYTYTWHWDESGLSSEISSWSMSKGSAAPGGTITYSETLRTASNPSISWSWGGVPGYSVSGPTSGTQGTYTGTYSGAPLAPSLSSVSGSPNPSLPSQTVDLSSNANFEDVNGGTYSWSDSAGSLSSTTASNPTWSQSVTGSYTISLSISTDAGSAVPVSYTQVVDPTLGTPSVTTSQGTVDSGQSFTLTATGSGGTGSYTYQWYTGSSGSGTAISGATSSTYTTSETNSGTTSESYGFYCVVTDTDSNFGSAASATITETVDPALGASISSSLNPSDVNQNVVYTAAGSGGSGSYTNYNFYLNGNSVQSGSGSQLTEDFASGPDSVYVVITDSNGVSATSGTISQTVNSDPTVSISSSQNPTDVGKSITLTASASGGTGSYSYQWYESGSAISGATSSTYTTSDYSSSGTYDYYVSVTDGAGYAVNSNTIDETVNSDPTVSASSNVSSADVNYPIEFSSSPSGGTSPYTYSWTIGGTQVSTSQDFSYSFSSAGSYTVEVTVTDAIGETYSASVTVTINNNPSVSVSSSQNPTDAGNAVTFTASESGGTGTISYAWTVNGASEGSGSTLDYSFSSAGSYTIEVTVTDSDGHVASSTLTETVYVDPSVSVSSSQNPTDVGNSVTFTASGSGGSGSYTYQWYVNSAAVSGATSSTYTTSFSSSGTDSIYVIIKDSVGNSATSSTLTETVNVDPSVSISSSQNPTDVGNSVTFTASGSGGTGSYSYQWYVNSASVSGATSSTYTTSFGSSGSDSVYVVITDGIGNTAQSSTLTETVNADPSVSISSSQNPTDVGNSVTFTASPSGGTGSYTYQWYVNSAAQSSTANELDTSFSSAGTYYINVTVKDSLGDSSSYSFIETVNPDPSVAISSSPAPTDVGVPVAFTSSASGGTSPYNYTWEINSVVVSYNSAFSYTFDSQGVYSVLLILADANGNTARATLNETVNADPTAIISTEYTTVDQGVNDTFTGNVNGGTYPFNYTWFSGSQIVNYSSSFHIAFTSTGQHTVRVEVRDSLGETTNASVIITVITKPSVSINGPDKTDVTTTTVFTGNATYGTEPYNFYWYVNGVNVTSSSSGLYLSYSFTSSGTYNVSIKAVDSEGASASAYILVNVYPKPTVSISAIKAEGDQGFTDSFHSSVSGGSYPISYEWYVGGNEVGSQQNLTYAFSSVGTIPVKLIITDFAGNSASAETNITVNPLPQVSISAKYLSLDMGVNDAFTASSSYGTGPYNYTWEVGGVAIGYGTTLDHAFSSSGTYSLKVILRDADGNTASSIITVYVNPAPVPSIFANRTVIDGGMGISFLSGISGGTGPYNYTWEIDGSIADYGSSFSHIFSSPGIYEITLTLRDAFNITATIEENITVNSVPSVSETAQHTSIDTGQPDSFFAVVSGGTSPYSFVWEINGNIVSSAMNMTYTFSSPGTYVITLIIRDALGASSSYTISITVNPDLSASLAIEYPIVDENITDTLALTAHNGTSPYTYSILIDGAAVSSSSTYSQYFTIPGTYNIVAYVNDSSGQGVRITDAIAVRTNPSVTIVTPTNRTDANVPVQFRGILSGGTGPYNYSWLIGGHSYSNPALVHAFTSSGKYVIQLTVTDIFGREAIANVNETVFGDPVATLAAPSYMRVSVEESLSLNITGGIAPYSIQWYFPGGEQFSGNNISYAFPESGPNTFEAKVTDASGYVDTQNFTVNVHLFVAIAANQTSGLGPLAVQFSSSVLGGSDYSYNWTFSPGHYSLLQNPTYQFPVGNYTVNFRVTSANGATGEKNLTIQSLPPPVSFNYSTGLNITQAFDFRAIPNWDASGPYSMSWSFPNGQTLTGMNVSYRFPVYSELNTVIASFSYGHGQTWSQVLTVRMIPAIPVITFSPPGIIPVDTMLALNATASAPDSNTFSYSWDINGTSDSGQSVLYYFGHAGNYSVSVTVTDGLGSSTTVTRMISVLPQESNSSIVISYAKSSAGPMTYYQIKVQSLNGITAVEAFMGTTMISPVEINSSYTGAGEVAYFNLSMDQGDYSSGTYGIKVVAFNNDSASNSITMPFSVSSSLSQNPLSLGTVIAFFGGLPNFLIIMLTLSGIGIAAMQLRKPPIDVVATSGGKTRTYQLDTKK